MKHWKGLISLILTVVLMAAAIPFIAQATGDPYVPEKYFFLDALNNINPQIKFNIDPADYQKPGTYTWSAMVRLEGEQEMPGHEQDESIQCNYYHGDTYTLHRAFKDANDWTEMTGSFNQPTLPSSLTFFLWYVNGRWSLADFTIKDPDGQLVYSMATDPALDCKQGLHHISHNQSIGKWFIWDFSGAPIDIQMLPADPYTPEKQFYLESTNNVNPQIQFKIHPEDYQKEGTYTWSVMTRMENEQEMPGHENDMSLQADYWHGSAPLQHVNVKDAPDWVEMTGNFKKPTEEGYLSFFLWYVDCNWSLADFTIKDPDGQIVYSMADDGAIAEPTNLTHGSLLGNWFIHDFNGHAIDVQVWPLQEPNSAHLFYLNSQEHINPQIHFDMKAEDYASGGPFTVDMLVKLKSKSPLPDHETDASFRVDGLKEGCQIVYEADQYVRVRGTVPNLTTDHRISTYLWYTDGAWFLADFTIRNAAGEQLYTMGTDPGLRALKGESAHLTHDTHAGNFFVFNFTGQPLDVIYFNHPVDENSLAVCKIEGTQESYHFNLRAPLKNAAPSDRILLLKDWADEHLVLPAGVTLDLNGRCLTAGNLLALNGANLVDSAQQKGLLKIKRDALVLPPENNMIPVFHAASGGYSFTAVTLQQMPLAVSETKDSFKFKFRPLLETAAQSQNIFSDGGTDNGLQIVVRIEWTDEQGSRVRRDFLVPDDMLRDAYPINGKQMAFYLRVIGVDAVHFRDMTVCSVVISDRGVEAVGSTQAFA